MHYLGSPDVCHQVDRHTEGAGSHRRAQGRARTTCGRSSYPNDHTDGDANRQMNNRLVMFMPEMLEATPSEGSCDIRAVDWVGRAIVVGVGAASLDWVDGQEAAEHRLVLARAHFDGVEAAGVFGEPLPTRGAEPA
jgi:hypothetical protein